MKVVLTCAGYASRLWPLTKDTPKPLLKVKDKPIIEHIINKALEIPRVDGVYIVTNDKFAPVFNEWLENLKFNIPVKILNDGTKTNETRLGQIGDVQFAIEKENISDDILVVAGDNLFNFSLVEAFDLFESNGLVVNPLYDIQSFKAAQELGTVKLDESTQKFLEFEEKAENPKSTLVSLGIYFFPKAKLPLIASYIAEGNNADKMGYFLTWLMEKEDVLGHVYYEPWFDIGWIDALEKARKEFLPK